MRRFEGKVALITGASRGIGRGIALCLAEEDADIVVNYYSHPDEAGQVAQAVQRLGRRALTCQADVSDRQAVSAMLAAAVERFGHLDVIVANAASQKHAPLIEAKWEDDRRTFDVTMFGVYHTCQAGAQQLVRQVTSGRPGGKIVIISSLHNEMPFATYAAYNMCKAAVNHLGRTLAAELIPYHINVNMINPGWIDTPGERAIFGDAVIDAGAARCPWGRMGRPEDIGRAVAYLASEDADYVTGATLLVDGGMKLAASVLSP
jgi:glucose 1-dehydrogenase